MDEIATVLPSDFPPLLTEITDPPEKLYVRGTIPPSECRWLCVVGSRNYSPYAKDAVEHLIAGLAGYPVVVVSGLALGIDALAHKIALAHKLRTVSVPGSGLSWDTLYPRSHETLARAIIESGGALISEFEPEFAATPWSFPQRNRIMAGLSHATLIIEAREQSGTLITARLALEYNREVLVVPHGIFSQNAAGSHRLLRDGATAVTSSENILEALGIQPNIAVRQAQNEMSEEERRVLALLGAGPMSRDEVIRQLLMPIQDANILLSALEVRGIITERLGVLRTT